jgi:tetratricopeptide (TPR) repeat protein
MGPATPLDREQRLDDAIADYLEAVDAGARPDPADWLARFPDLAADLARFFGEQDRVHNLLGGLDPAATLDLAPTIDTTPHDTPTPVPTAIPLEWFGNYELVEEIARGGMGVVYRARQASLNRTVALKMILAGRLALAADVQRFRSEAEAAAHLEHPHIVPLYEVGEHDGQHYFTMKLIEGGSLAQHAGRFQADPQATARLLATVARAVHYAHQRGILHRDLKPANVLLDERGRPHLTDFGLARRLQGGPDLTRTGIAVGTPSYMAPEQATAGGRAVTTAADVYSLGAILYELLTGRPPFRTESPLETLRQVLEREPDRPRALNRRVSRDLENICLKCLEKEPARRYPSAAELADDLDRYQRGELVRARRAGAVERLWRWCRRRPLVAALSAALVLSLAVGAGLITWQWRRAEAHLAQAEAERARAEEGFREAHRAVNDFCTRVSEGQLRDVPGLQPVRRELLEAALAYYARFLRERGDDPALKAELADIHFRIATITSLLGSKPEALTAYARARTLYEELLQADPISVPLRAGLAETHARIGVLQADTGQPAAALTSYLRASRLYGGLLQERPGDMGLRNGTARVYTHLGQLHRWAGRTAETQACLDKARDLQEEVVRRQPTVAEFRANLAVIYSHLAALEAALGKRPEALLLARQAQALQEDLVREHPLNLHFQQQLAFTCRFLAGGLCVAKQFDEAETAVQRAQALLEHLVEAEPRIAGLKADLSTAYRQAGHIYREQGMLPEALVLYDKALAVMAELVRDQPEVTDFRNDLAKCYFDRAALLGRMNEWEKSLESNRAAVELRRELVKANPGHVGYHSDLGLSLGNMSVDLTELGRLEEAVAVVREAVKHHRAAFTGAPEVTKYRGFLGGACGQLAEYAADLGLAEEAMAAALEWKKLWPNNPKQLCDVAAHLARVARWRPSCRRLTGERPADLAVAVLREAVAAGFRDGPKLRKDPAFAALRGRGDFEEILTTLAVGNVPDP